MIPIKDDIPAFRRPIVTVGLIVLNVAVFLYEAALGPDLGDFLLKYGAVPFEITHFRETTPQMGSPITLTVFTSMFLHGGWFHVGSNMLYLWIFGNNVEDRLGHVRFLLFYLAAGVVAMLAFVVTGPNAEVPLVGASGAVSGVLGAYVVAYPRARVLTLIWVFFFVRMVWLPAALFLGFWFILQIISGLPTLAGTGHAGVAYFAHVGGFAFGMLCGWLSRLRQRRRFG